VVADLNRLAEQAAGVVAQVEDQAVQIAEAVDGLNHFLRRGLLELLQVDVADAGANLIFKVHGGVGNLVAHQREHQRLGLPSRVMLTCTGVPLGPLSVLATTSEVMPSVTCRRWPRSRRRDERRP
jgi:hypothetical protein